MERRITKKQEEAQAKLWDEMNAETFVHPDFTSGMVEDEHGTWTLIEEKK